jgi:purine catabolism regulator
MPSITVRDILRLALPPGTSIEAGAIGLTHQITWVASLRAALPAFANLRGGELALLSVQAAQQLDENLTLAELVRRLAQAPVAAVAALGAVGEDDRAAAEAVRLPLLRLPDGSDLREVEREVQRLVSDYDAQLERRGAQLYNLLTQRSLAGMGIPGLLEVLAERTGQGVACYAGNGELRVIRARGSARIALQSLRPGPGSLPDPGDEPLQLLSQQIWLEPIGGQPGGRRQDAGGGASPDRPPPADRSLPAAGPPAGYLAIAGAQLDAWDRLAASQAATALALELAREQAVQATEERLRGDFLSGILAGPPTDTATLTQRGQELGYDLAQPHVALLCTIDGADTVSLSRVVSSLQSELTRRGIAAPLLRREGTVLCLLPLGAEASGGSEAARARSAAARPRELAEALRLRLAVDYSGVVLALGTPALSLADWPRTFEEAEQALVLGRQLFGPERVLAFGDLGVYRLLVRLRETPELWTFYRETLSKLAAYDQKQPGAQGELLKTLEAYFNNLSNLARTAKALHVHRNTLLYRLERINQISGLDLDDPEEHFALWLALKAHRVLRTLEE